MEKSRWLFVEGTRPMLTSGFAYKNTSFLSHSMTRGLLLELWLILDFPFFSLKLLFFILHVTASHLPIE